MSTHSDVIAAVQSGEAGKVRDLLQNDRSLAAARDSNGVSAVMHAFYYRRPEIADLFIAAKSELDIFEATAAGKADKVSEILRQIPELPKAGPPTDLRPCTLRHFSTGLKSRVN